MEELADGDPRSAGPYQLVARLGGGGMGQVFLGRSPGARPVAVKMIRSDLAGDLEFQRRFAREIRAARKVNGFYTAEVIDAAPDARPPWMATAYIKGPSLAEAIDGHGPLHEDGLRILGASLAEGLATIHQSGLVHRDLKPGNVILAEDGPRLIDFGIARALDATPSTVVIGTPGFMSPEQARARDIGPASDVFCLGAVLAFAATGAGPFGTGRPDAVLYRVVHEKPDLAALRHLPPDLQALVAGCLAKDPAARPSLETMLTRVAAPAVPLGTPDQGLAASDLGLVPDDLRIRNDRHVVLDFLREKITYENEPWVFDDDLLMFAVARLKNRDPRWIRAQTRISAWPQDLVADLLVLLRVPVHGVHGGTPGGRHFGILLPDSPTPPTTARD